MISFLCYVAAGLVLGWTIQTNVREARRVEKAHLTRMRRWDRELRRKT